MINTKSPSDIDVVTKMHALLRYLFRRLNNTPRNVNGIWNVGDSKDPIFLFLKFCFVKLKNWIVIMSLSIVVTWNVVRVDENDGINLVHCDNVKSSETNW